MTINLLSLWCQLEKPMTLRFILLLRRCVHLVMDCHLARPDKVQPTNHQPSSDHPLQPLRSKTSPLRSGLDVVMHYTSSLYFDQKHCSWRAHKTTRHRDGRTHIALMRPTTCIDDGMQLDKNMQGIWWWQDERARGISFLRFEIGNTTANLNHFICLFWRYE